jgi:hypothetical protein
MIIGTTPHHIFNVTLKADEISKVKITYKQNGEEVLVKRESDCDITDYKISVRLSQEDTFKFSTKYAVELQIRVVTSGDDVASSFPIRISADACLDNEVL